MICKPCRIAGRYLTEGEIDIARDQHLRCPEIARRAKLKTERLPLSLTLVSMHMDTGRVCDCQHDTTPGMVNFNMTDGGTLKEVGQEGTETPEAGT